MRTRKIFAAGAAAVMCVSLVMGTGNISAAAAEEEVTAESLLNGFFESTGEAESSSFKLGMDMDVSMNIMGSSQTINMDIALDVQNFKDTTYMNGYMKGTFVENGEEVPSEEMIEQYVLQEDGKYVTFSHDLKTDTWSSMEVEKPAFSFDMIPKFDTSKFTLEEEDAQYVVSGNIDLIEAIEALPDMIPDVESMFGSLGEISGEAEVTYTFNKETKEMTGVKIDLGKAMQGFMDQALTEIMAAFSEIAGSSGTQEEVDLSTLFSADFKSFAVEITDVTINQGSEIVLPDEAKAVAATVEGSTSGGATQSSGAATLPSGTSPKSSGAATQSSSAATQTSSAATQTSSSAIMSAGTATQTSGAATPSSGAAVQSSGAAVQSSGAAAQSSDETTQPSGTATLPLGVK